MAQNVIDSLVISLGLDAKGVDTGISQAEARIAGGVKNIVGNILAPLLGAFAFKSLISGYTQTADSLGKLAQSLNVGVNDLDAWGNAARQAGGSASGFQSSLQALNSKIVDVTVFGRKMTQQAFTELGIKLTDANKKAKTSIQVLEELAAVADKMDKTKFAALAKKLGFDQGTIQLLQSGKKNVLDLVEAQKRMAYTERDAEVAAEYNSVLQDLGTSAQSAASIFLRILIPAITKGADLFRKGVDFLRQHEPFVIAFFTTLAGIIAYKLIPVIAALSKTLLASPMAKIFKVALFAATLLASVIDDLFVYIEGGTSKLNRLWAVFGTGEEIAEGLGKAWSDLKEIGDAVFSALGKVLDAFVDSFGDAFGSLVTVIVNTLSFIKALFTGTWEDVFNSFVNLWNSLGQFLIDVIVGAINFVVGFVAQAIKGILSKIPDFLLPDKIKDWAKDVDKIVSDVAIDASAALAPNAAGMPGNALSTLSPAATVNETNSYTVGDINVTAQTSDPATLGRTAGEEFRKVVNAGNKGVVGR